MLLMNIEIILLNEQMTQNKVKDILNKKIKKTKKNNLEPAVVVFLTLHLYKWIKYYQN